MSGATRVVEYLEVQGVVTYLVYPVRRSIASTMRYSIPLF